MIVQGLINKIIYDGRKKGQDFVIFSIQEIESIGKRPVFHKVVGKADELISDGEYVEIEGEITTNEYGDQISYSSIASFKINEELMTSNMKENAIVSILSSISKVGYHTAKLIYTTLDLDKSDSPLKEIFYSVSDQGEEIPRLSALAKEAILEDLINNSKKIGFIYKLMMYSNAITKNQAVKAFDEFGDFSLIKDNPYQLVKVNGITFATADRIAKESAGHEAGSREQVKAALYYVMQESLERSGNTWMGIEGAHDEVIKLIGDVVSLELVKDISENEYNDFHLDGEKLFLKRSYMTETSIAKNLNRLINSQDAFKQGMERTAKMIENGEFSPGDDGMELSEEQNQAILTSLNNKLTIITGGPGVGKTTVLKGLIKAFKQSGADNNDIMCVAPTGKAAKRMEESTGLAASTIHRALDYGNPTEGEFGRNSANKLDGRILIADEQSMTDNYLAKSLLEAAHNGAHVVLVGDVNQLPSVGAGVVLRNLINSGTVPVSRLTKIFRQALDSGIVTKSHSLITGSKEAFYKDIDNYEDMNLLEIDEHIAASYSKSKGIDMSADQLVSKMCVNKYKKMMKNDYCPYNDIQVLTPMRKGECGVFELNKAISAAINPSAAEFYLNKTDKPKIDSSDYTFFEGDKIIQTKNDYEMNLMNGETGLITTIDKFNREVACIFGERSVTISYADFLKNIQPAWAITGHKSQGSEYKGVIIPLSKSHIRMMSREYLYTVMTRAKKELHMIGDFKMIDAAIQNRYHTERLSGLKDRIHEYVELDNDMDSEQQMEMGLK